MAAANARKPPTERTDDLDSSIILSHSQKDSILALQHACSELPFPSHLLNARDDDDQDDSLSSFRVTSSTNSRAPSFLVQDVSIIIPRPNSDKDQQQSTNKNELLFGVDHPIENTQQFFAWFSRIEEEMESGQEDIYRSYLESIYTYQQTCDDVLSTIASTRQLLNNLKENHESVEEKTKGLQLACEKLLAEQMHLLHVAQQVTVRLNYFNDLEPIAKLFSSPGEAVCLDDKFVPFLHRLDECIAFVQSNMNYRDAELYTMRFRQCMTRGMSLLKLHVINTFRGLQTDIKDRLANRPPNEALPPSLYTSLFYVKFKTVAPRLKALVAEIETRVPGHREYQSLLHDCYNGFSSTRSALLDPQIQLHVHEIATDKDLLSFARSGSVYMTSVCRDEHTLFYQFFNSGEDELSGYLESLSMHLYDALRPLILRESRIDVLSDLCLSIQAAMTIASPLKPLATNSTFKTDDNEDEDYESGDDKDLMDDAVDEERKQLNGCEREKGSGDGRDYITSSIEGFKPRDDEILLFARGRGLPLPGPVSTSSPFAPVLSQSTSPQTQSSATSFAVEGTVKPSSAVVPVPLVPASAPTSTDSRQSSLAGGLGQLTYGSGEWYPTMQRCLYILGKLYRCVPTAVFEDLAEEAVDVCRASLVRASIIIASKQTKTDGELFLIKNLLMLREQIAPFDVAFVRRQEVLDFGALSEAVSSVLANPLSFGNFSQAVLASAALPKVVERYPDAKEGVDKELKRICEDFILDTTRSCVEPLSSFLLKVQAFKLRDSSIRPSSVPRLSLPSQNFAQPAQVLQIQDAFREVLSKRLGHAISRMADYLGDKRTEAVLVRVMRANIIDTYQSFYDIVQSEYDLSVQERVQSLDTIATLIDHVCLDIKSKSTPNAISIIFYEPRENCPDCGIIAGAEYAVIEFCLCWEWGADDNSNDDLESHCGSAVPEITGRSFTGTNQLTTESPRLNASVPASVDPLTLISYLRGGSAVAVSTERIILAINITVARGYLTWTPLGIYPALRTHQGFRVERTSRHIGVALALNISSLQISGFSLWRHSQTQTKKRSISKPHQDISYLVCCTDRHIQPVN
ncbi:hypothetical protein SeMB42_g00231 [Synchytrium endobioticum]|uniref:Conserved oligomeric Golgi complex subunit 3 n=1 Tax=Synchytrium endobioticum TaxID=286115 RepID=A0A507DTI5_9FUNG|nr:hypothetical protein SeMB42_g00231 [Synchytrium endobioticum]